MLDMVLSAYLREGSVRRSVIGPYRGITFELSTLMVKRREVYYRAYEPNVTRWLTTNVLPGMEVYVVGAHLGIHALMIAKLLRGAGHVHAFEGWPENYSLLVRNVACNGRLSSVVTPHHLAVADCSGLRRMFQGPSDGRHHLGAPGEAVGRAVAVPATTLDDFWSRNAVQPNVIILDIEGFELQALAGAERLLEKCRPRLAVEHHRRQEELRMWLQNHDYLIESSDRRHLFARAASS